MKTGIHSALILSALITISGCGADLHAEVVPTTDPQVLQASVGVFSQSFQNPYGTVEFQLAAPGTVQVLRTCTAGDTFCNSMNLEASSNFILKLNDATSAYPRSVNGNLWTTTASGDSDQIDLSTLVQDSNGAQVEVIDETYQMNDDPCGYGEGPGLEAHQIITQNSNGQEWSTDSCQAFY